MSFIPAALSFLPESVGHVILFLGSFALLLLGAEIFTNSVEWLGHRLDVGESATGSILAAVGTALPETMIAIIAIIQGGKQGAHVGVGAILGAPFMLATIAMCLVGVSVLYFARRRSHGAEFYFNSQSTRRDLSFFLVGYTLALAAAFVSKTLSYVIGAVLVLLYVYYVYRSLQSGDLIEEEGLDDLYLGSLVEKGRGPIKAGVEGNHSGNPGTLLVIVQTAFALAIIILGAHLFVTEVQWVASAIGLPAAVIALLLAPLATELPEKFNSVLWISRDKDTLAIGNITGAMAFQGTLPVTLGILFTPWNLSLNWGTANFLYTLSAILAIVSGFIVYERARANGEGTMDPKPFLIGGLFYLVFVIALVYHVINFALGVA